MSTRFRDDDHRPDELLEEHGRIVAGLGLAIAWTSGIRGEKAKVAADKGSGAWKRATPLPDEEHAAGLFKQRCRTRNPVVVASKSRLVLIEVDGDEGLLDVELPATVTARSRQGLHRYYQPDEGMTPGKFQVSADGVTHWEDGYLVLPPALHPSGVVYEFIANGSIGVLPADLHRRLLRKGEHTERQVEEVVREGGKVPAGHRDRYVFLRALAMAHDGLSEEEILPSMLKLARDGCEPPLAEENVHKQVRGAVRRAKQKPPANRQLRSEAEQTLLAATSAARAVTSEVVIAPVQVTAAPATSPSDDRPGVVAVVRRRRLRFVKVSAVAPAALAWLVPGLLPLGALTMLAGVGGLGKSQLACQWSARLTRGELPAQGAVIYVSYEDPAQAVLRPRLEAAGADLDAVAILEEQSALPVLPEDLPELHERARSEGARLLVIDPITAAISLKLDAHKDRDIRVLFGQLAALAQQLDLAVLMVGHLNKAPSREAYIRVSGSVAFYNAARSVATITLDPEDEDCRLLAQHKANWMRLAPVERHRVEPVSYQHEEQTIETSKLVYVENAEGVDPYAVLEQIEPRARTKTDDAVSFLLALLGDGAWHKRGEVEELAAAAGISARTLERAAALHGIESKREGFPSVGWWRLPSAPAAPPNPYTDQLAQL